MGEGGGGRVEFAGTEGGGGRVEFAGTEGGGESEPESKKPTHLSQYRMHGRLERVR